MQTQKLIQKIIRMKFVTLYLIFDFEHKSQY